MNIDISSISKVNGASLTAEFDEMMDNLDTIDESFVFDKPVSFKGTVENISGIFKLEGRLKIDYTVECSRCLGDISRNMNIAVKEQFISSDKASDIEAYTYEGTYIDISKALKDNIILNLPMRLVCSEDCKGICPDCGNNLNTESCECNKEDAINPKMEVLKDFFNS